MPDRDSGGADGTMTSMPDAVDGGPDGTVTSMPDAVDGGPDGVVDAMEPDAPDASPGDGHAADAGPCVDTLDRVANTWGLPCPAASAAADGGFPCGLADGGATILTGSCGALRMLGFYWGTHAQYCFYPGDGGTLVGATANDDVPSFCGQTSYTISSGVAREVVTAVGTTWTGSGQSCSPTTWEDCAPPDASGD